MKIVLRLLLAHMFKNNLKKAYKRFVRMKTHKKQKTRSQKSGVCADKANVGDIKLA